MLKQASLDFHAGYLNRYDIQDCEYPLWGGVVLESGSAQYFVRTWFFMGR